MKYPIGTVLAIDEQRMIILGFRNNNYYYLYSNNSCTGDISWNEEKILDQCCYVLYA